MEMRIKELRIQNNLTQSGLAMEVGCSQNLISRIEHGKAKPTSDILKAMSKIFNVSVDYILCETQLPYKADTYVNLQQSRLFDYLNRIQKLPIDKQKIIEEIIRSFEDAK